MLLSSPVHQHVRRMERTTYTNNILWILTCFLPCDAMRKRGLCCLQVSVCPFVRLSVRLSRWWIVSTRLKISSNFFLGLVAPSLYFSDPQHRYPIPTGTLSAGAQSTRGGKVCDFRVKSPFISKTVRDRPIVVMER